MLDAATFEMKGDTARDALGLVHFSSGTALIAVIFQSELAERRADRGRPTAIDAQGNPRFICEATEKTWEPGWGRTANLAHLDGSRLMSGLPERICGPFPPADATGVTVEVLLLGSPQLPRADVMGVGDSAFADLLEIRTTQAAGGTLLRDQVENILTP